MPLRATLLLAALLHAFPALAEVIPLNEKAATLLNKGLALDAEGKAKEAMEHFTEAAKIAPTASAPLSMIADMWLRASRGAPVNEVGQYRQVAGTKARAALKLDDRDPVAMEVLRKLSDGDERKRHAPSPAAEQAAVEGERLFSEKKYDEARAKYELAVQRDPAFVQALVYVGDCYFMQGDMLRAEQTFHKATQLDPLLGQAWRFLFDALLHQGKLKDAEAAALGALAANPGEKPNWMRVGHLMKLTTQQKLAPFQLVRKAMFEEGKIVVDPEAAESDAVFWLGYGLALAAGKPSASPFARELEAWTSALIIAAEGGKADQITDESVRQMLRFHKAGQLKAAIFALLYREAYRPEFEAWKKAEPDGLKRFVDTFRTGPL